MRKPQLTTSAWVQMMLRESFTSRDISSSLNKGRTQGYLIVDAFLKAGYIAYESGKKTPCSPNRYRVVLGLNPRFYKAKTNTGKYTKTAQQQLWNNMKIAHKFSIDSLLSSISVSRKQANPYIRNLIRGGYIKPACSRSSSNDNDSLNGQYMLIRDTGRIAPMTRAYGVWDSNLNYFFKYKDSINDLVR